MTLLDECLDELRRAGCAVSEPEASKGTYIVVFPDGDVPSVEMEANTFRLRCLLVHEDTPHRCRATG